MKNKKIILIGILVLGIGLALTFTKKPKTIEKNPMYIQEPEQDGIFSYIEKVNPSLLNEAVVEAWLVDVDLDTLRDDTIREFKLNIYDEIYMVTKAETDFLCDAESCSWYGQIECKEPAGCLVSDITVSIVEDAVAASIKIDRKTFDLGGTNLSETYFLLSEIDQSKLGED